MSANYRKSTGRFHFYNANPKNSLSANDCVFRAISTAQRKTWEETYLEICQVGLRLMDAPTSKKVIETYLKEQGYVMQKQLRKANNTKFTVEEFAAKFNVGAYVLSLTGHLTCVVNGKILDTWNCSDMSVGNYWEVI